MKTELSKFIKTIFVAGLLLVGVNSALAQDEPEKKPVVGKKQIPEITFKNLSPPYKDYVYFEAHAQFPFQYNATQFNLINAWWLAEISTLVYADEDFVRLRFEKAGLGKVNFFNKDSTQCYVASNDKFAVVAFRGSEIWKREGKFDLGKIFADLGADVDIWLTDWRQGGKVHRGFKNALEEVWTDLYAYIQPLHERGCKIWFTGHSLGAALATLAADRYPHARDLYTYGSPRVGNDKFIENFKVNAYRMINNEDIATRVPPPGFYKHVGEVRYIDAKGTIHNQLIKKERPSAQPRDEHELYGEDSNEENKTSFSGFIPDAFRDHVPLLYTIHIWNSIVSSNALE
jgi:hypothetical protein